MTDTANTNIAKLPSHIAYQVRDREGRKAIFTEVGAGWPHKDSGGFNLHVTEAVQPGEWLTIRVARKKR